MADTAASASLPRAAACALPGTVIGTASGATVVRHFLPPGVDACCCVPPYTGAMEISNPKPMQPQKVQVATPVDERRLTAPVLRGPTGKPVVKLFLFAPAESYDLIAQDEVANATQKFAHLDPFTTPSSGLPSGAAAAGEPLPVLPCNERT